MLVLAEKKPITVADRNLRSFVERLFEGMREAPLNRHVAVASRQLKMMPHGDPADRFIAATSQAYDLILVSEDARLAKAPDLHVFR